MRFCKIASENQHKKWEGNLMRSFCEPHQIKKTDAVFLKSNAVWWTASENPLFSSPKSRVLAQFPHGAISLSRILFPPLSLSLTLFSPLTNKVTSSLALFVNLHPVFHQRRQHKARFSPRTSLPAPRRSSHQHFSSPPSSFIFVAADLEAFHF